MRIISWLWNKYHARGRVLFQFHDGERTRRVDPLEVARRLFADPEFDWDETPRMLMTGHAAMQLETFRIIGNAVRRAFEVPSVEGGGLSEIECLELLTRFRGYLGDVKKNGSLFPISPEPTGSPPVNHFPTKPGWDFGSTANEPSIVPPGSPAAPIQEASAVA